MSQYLPGKEASHATSPDVMDDKQRTINKYFFGKNGHLEYPQATLYTHTHFEYIFTKHHTQEGDTQTSHATTTHYGDKTSHAGGRHTEL